jgi:sortase A
MKKFIRIASVASVLVFGMALLLTLHVHTLEAQNFAQEAASPLPPQTGGDATSSPQTPPPVEVAVSPTPAAVQEAPGYPTRIQIPSIGLNARVVNVGLTQNGEMDVPDGRTKNVGWYKYGTLPGDVGSAVMDAHVYAAFSSLHKTRVGNVIYVETSNNTTLRFVVTKVATYALKDVPAQELFSGTDGRHLNLITCAGALTPDHSTYDHRLVVYATLDETHN